MKERLTKRVAVIVGTTVIALGATGFAVAQNSGSPKDERKAFLNDAAQRLDVSPEKLTQALKDAAIARIDAAVKAGRLTEAQANEMKEHIRSGQGIPFLGGPRGPHGGPGHHRGGPPPGITAAAKYLGLTEAQLREQLMDDKSLADVAEARNKSVDGLKDAMEKAIRADIAKAVKDKRITQQQADRILENLESRIDEKVEAKGGRHGHGGPGRGGPGGPPPGGPPPGGPGFGPPPGDPPPPPPDAPAPDGGDGQDG